MAVAEATLVVSMPWPFSVMPSRTVGPRPFRNRTIELATRTLSIRSTPLAWPVIAPAPLGPISAFVMGETLSRRRFAHPRRQHFEIDQFVEFDRGVRHSSSLRQWAAK
jgi:hypothetical protein